jgi:hypothetical protein
VVPDAKRTKATPTQSSASPASDPRLALAQQHLRQAAAKLAEEEAGQRRPNRRRPAVDGQPHTSGFMFSIAPATWLHVLLAAIVLTLDALLLLFTYHMLLVNLVVGRVIALPAGVVTAAAWAYLSVCYLGIIESTSTGHTNVDSLQGDWQEWFWTLPATLGMLAISAAVGWGLSFLIPINIWLLIALAVLLFYPIFQLSSLETGSPLAPLSLPVVGSLAKHPIAWFVLFASSFAVADVLWLVGRLLWRDPPYSTLLVMGPIVTVALFFYAWLLGQLAHLISTDIITEKES